MTFARPQAFTSSVASAATRIELLRRQLCAAETTSFGEGGALLALGVPAIDQALGGGLIRGVLHEIAAAHEPESAAAIGFALALAARSNDRSVSLQYPLVPARGTPSRLRDGDPVAGTQMMNSEQVALDARLCGHERAGCVASNEMRSRRTVVWIAEDLSRAENGALYGPGLDEAGIAPEQLITVAAARGRDVLWAMEEALRCRAVGAVIGELRARDIDQVATRRLSLAAASGNTLGLFLRTAPNDDPSAAATRWIIGAAPSASFSPSPERGGSDCRRQSGEGSMLIPNLPPTRIASRSDLPLAGGRRGIGLSRLTARLVRNRRGHLGTWIVEWNSVEQRFELATDSEPVAGAAFDRSHRAAVA